MLKVHVSVLCFLVTVSSKKENCIEEEKPCEEGWKLFERDQGKWCMKVVFEDNISQSKAEIKCQNLNSTLSGLQDQRENLYVLSTVLNEIHPETGTIRIGLQRRAECRTVWFNENCTAMNSFEWTDKHTTGTDGILWDRDQPDNAWGRTQHCALMVVSGGGYTLHSQAGTMDDIQCEFDFIEKNEKPRQTRAFICGKKAAF